jgi:hypothetical protein
LWIVYCDWGGDVRHALVLGDSDALRREWFSRAFSAFGAACFMTLSTACSTQSGAVRTEVGFLCSVKGAELLIPSMTNTAVCKMFKDRIDQALAHPTQAVKTVVSSSAAEWIKLNIRFSKPGTAAAVLVRRDGAREFSHPEIAVEVMDKPLGQNEVIKLAAEVAKLVSESAGK